MGLVVKAMTAGCDPPEVAPEVPPDLAAGVASRLRAGVLVGDAAFDLLYPDELRIVSSQHWTPVAVAARAAQMLVDAGASRIADVGAGPGKFCLIGALTTGARFTGMERRAHLVATARHVAQRLSADRAHFVRADVLDCTFDGHDGFYFYNPFYEQICTSLLPIDDDLDPCPLLFRKYVLAAAERLARAPVGTAVVTYHGFGGVMPPGYERVHREAAGNDHLSLWRKRPPEAAPL